MSGGNWKWSSKGNSCRVLCRFHGPSWSHNLRKSQDTRKIRLQQETSKSSIKKYYTKRMKTKRSNPISHQSASPLLPSKSWPEMGIKRKQMDYFRPQSFGMVEILGYPCLSRLPGSLGEICRIGSAISWADQPWGLGLDDMGRFFFFNGHILDRHGHIVGHYRGVI